MAARFLTRIAFGGGQLFRALTGAQGPAATPPPAAPCSIRWHPGPTPRR